MNNNDNYFLINQKHYSWGAKTFTYYYSIILLFILIYAMTLLFKNIIYLVFIV